MCTAHRRTTSASVAELDRGESTDGVPMDAVKQKKQTKQKKQKLAALGNKAEGKAGAPPLRRAGTRIRSIRPRLPQEALIQGDGIRSRRYAQHRSQGFLAAPVRTDRSRAPAEHLVAAHQIAVELLGQRIDIQPLLEYPDRRLELS